MEHGQVWDILHPNLTMPQIRFGISQVRFGTWSSLEHDHPKSKFPVWDVPNRNSDLGYPKFDLGYGQVWATTAILGMICHEVDRRLKNIR